MKALLWVGAALLLPAVAVAQPFVAAASAYGQPLGGGSPTPPLPAEATYYTQQVAGGGSITYFGAVCSQNCQHEQFAKLRRAFETSRPNVVFYEKPEDGVDSTETATISRLGEAGYIRYLAEQHQVPVARLDDPVAEYTYLQTKIDPERLKLLCLLRETQRFRAHTNASRAVTKKAMQSFIKNSAYFLPGTEHVIRNTAELELAYRLYFPTGGKWWDAPAGWFNPAVPVASVSNPDIEDFRNAVREFREQTMYGKLMEKAQNGQRVFVVINRDYLPLVRN
ncbi:hypothetical protein GO988_01505 [Hymenobacter sp. HMF4947]|uniref:Uncharacterized protein n=1 Tax=Hymenobacter ginkgonis TaxID=2682976 RepID=A0A7K1T9B9_9BACT|nr:hypothetical protein [Hymenobacter ginkgonis]MVN74995.1 hypothetical protein [Hymenobacter ginkgonis]